jgi:DNA-binding response OmpR family regulator
MDKLRVLVADDDPRIRQVISINLKKRNWAVYEVENGGQVVEYLKREIPDLIVLDLGMPVMNGYDVCAWIRQRGMKVPILVLTAYAGMDLKIRALDAGADDYVTKPFKTDEFLARLNALVNRPM